MPDLLDWWTCLILWTYRHVLFDTNHVISLKHSSERQIDASFLYVYLYSDDNDDGDDDDDDYDDADDSNDNDDGDGDDNYDSEYGYYDDESIHVDNEKSDDNDDGDDDDDSYDDDGDDDDGDDDHRDDDYDIRDDSRPPQLFSAILDSLLFMI